ncbi:MAG: TlpA family protein disulfide reductase [Acidobacteria bacterium]|nr:MAG: TlpA family protein disulfide reductase [Acidobacteriota bacterium]
MANVRTGDKAPNFELKDLDGKRVSLQEALKRGPVVAAFFKVSCPVCQFTFPFLERLFKAYASDRTTFWALSQDDARDTREFCAEYGVTFPALVDDDGYPTSNDYGLTNVPTYYLIARDGTVQVDSVGFGKNALEKLSEALARFLGRPVAAVFNPGEVVPDSKPG